MQDFLLNHSFGLETNRYTISVISNKPSFTKRQKEVPGGFGFI